MKYLLTVLAILAFTAQADAWVGKNGKHHDGPRPDCHATLRGC